MSGSASDARRAWTVACEYTRDTANMVREHKRPDAAQLKFLHGEVMRLKAAFPLRYPAASALSVSFLMVAKAFLGGDCSPLLAASVAAMAGDLLDMLEADRRVAFEHSCRAAGE